MRVKIGFKDLSIPAQIERGRHIENKMTGNVHFPDAGALLLALHDALAALEIAYNNASDGGKKLRAIRTIRQKAMLAIISELAAYVQVASHGDREIILSSGFDVVERGGPLGIGQVMNLRTKPGRYAGSIRAIWKKVTGAHSYIVEISDSGPSGEFFRLYRVVVQTRLNILGLVAGKIYWVRVTAVGRPGYGLSSSLSPASASMSI